MLSAAAGGYGRDYPTRAAGRKHTPLSALSARARQMVPGRIAGGSSTARTQ